MDRLESCYFCGTSDGTLDEYPVVPDSLSPTPDEQAAVTLCPDCRRKLATVVKRIAAVAEDTSADAAAVSGPTAAPTDAEEPAEPAGEPETSEPLPPEADTEPSAPQSPEADDPDREASPDAGAAPDEDAEDQTPETLSPFQYNKVMRLLENREFPVDVAEFESIATNAYQLEPGDVQAVIEAAIDRGLIERGPDGETLHRSG